MREVANLGKSQASKWVDLSIDTVGWRSHGRSAVYLMNDRVTGFRIIGIRLFFFSLSLLSRLRERERDFFFVYVTRVRTSRLLLLILVAACLLL